jgi:hypothetical protein
MTDIFLTEHTNPKLIPYLDQDYYAIKKECLKSGKLFEDPLFPAIESSLGKKDWQKLSLNLIWKRPKELCENPMFIVNGIHPNDLDQGQVQDW